MHMNSHPAHASTLFGLRFTVRLVMLVAALLVVPGASATTNVTDYFTPTGLTPGAPAGSYALSGFETINPYSGNLNFSLPLLHVGGRGTAGYTMMLKSNLRWTIDRDYDANESPIFTPIFNWWLSREVGYGPGIMAGRQQIGQPCNLADQPPGPYVTETYTLTRLTFTSAAGTEYDLLDQRWHGQPKISQCYTSGQPNYYGVSRGKVFATVDGSAATFVSDEEIKDIVVDTGGELAATGTLYMRDGTRYRIVNGSVMSITDRNGNSLLFDYDSSGRVTTIDDSLNRRITIEYGVNDGQYGVCDQIKYRGFGNAERIIRVARTTLSNTLHPDYTLKTISQLFGQDFPSSSSTTYNNPMLPSVVWLPGDTPSTTRKYQLLYNSHAELAKVVLPTGGAFEYVWGGETVFGVELFRHVTERRVLSDGNTLEGKTTYSRSNDFSVNNLPRHYVDEARYGKNNVLLAKTKHYYYGSPTASLIHGYQFNYSGWFEGKEYKTEYLDIVGETPLRRVEQDWQQGEPVAWWRSPAQYGAPVVSNIEPSNNPRINETKTTLVDSGQVTKQTFAYDRYNNKTDIYEHDYGTAGSGVAGPLIRHTRTEYVTTNTIGGVSYDYACDPEAACSWNGLTPNVIHLRSLPRVRRVYAVNPETLAETPISKSESRYDEATYAPFTYSGITVPGWAAPATPVRGNQTSVRSYLNANASVEPDQSCPTSVCIETHMRYDQLGNVREVWDANGNLTELTYLDSFCNDDGVRCNGTFTPNTYAFPTRAESAGPGAPYGTTAPLASTAVYDYYTGLLYTATDVNDKSTRFEYVDPLDRITARVRQDGARTDFYYSQADEPRLYVRTLTDLDGARRLMKEQYFDGLGRPTRSFDWESQDTSNPWLTVDTHYDALGRVRKTSNPYRSTGPESELTEVRVGTETTFDALGRVTQVKTTADGACVKTDYKGSRVLVTDQSNRQRISRTDALGRLREVWEVTPDDSGKYPGVESVPSEVSAGLLTSAHGYGTEYFYDVLDNLRRVKQGTQARFFAYDSLSRLVRSKNPEQGSFAANGDFPELADSSSGVNNNEWAMGYLYDANGNVTKRRDARGATATYAYDSLNRNITVTYTTVGTGAAVTPDVKRYYDNDAEGANGQGRLWKSEAVHTAQTSVVKYDEVGRPKEQTQRFWVDNNWGPQVYTTKLSYNKAGGVTSQEYPSGQRVEYQYEALGRLGDQGQMPAFKGTLGDGVERTYASQMLYDELGGRSQERFGTQTPIYNKHLYNVRGQLAEIRVSTYAITNTDPNLRMNWNRGAVINYYGTSASGTSSSGPDNNGNLLQQDVLISQVDGPGYDQGSNVWLATHKFDYDALNRLKRVEGEASVAGQPTHWAQAYDYDRWGNRTINADATQVYDQNPSYSIPESQFDLNPTGDYREVSQPSNRLYAEGDNARLPQHKLMRYDAAGNLVHDAQTGTGNRTYDAENRLTAGSDKYNGTANYAYDADGRRVKRLVGSGGEVWQVYGSGGELLAEYAKEAAHTSPRKEYGYRGGELLVTAEVNAAGWGPPPAFGDPDPLGTGDQLKLEHLTDLRAAVNQLRQHAGLPQYNFTVDPNPVRNVTVAKADHIRQLRAALEAARSSLSLSTGGYAHPELTEHSSLIYAIDFQELREQIRGAWQSGTDGAVLRWLVADQLGTPRMILDQTGSLAGVSRHDYLPFGEELFAGTGGRTQTLGYTNGDNARQKFTAAERDDETSLDYMQARYYSSRQGRFISVDPLLSSGNPANPKTWNRYVYALNNPLRYKDPTGLDPEDGQSTTGTTGGFIISHPCFGGATADCQPADAGTVDADPNGDWSLMDDLGVVADTFVDGILGFGRGVAGAMSFGHVGGPQQGDSVPSLLGQGFGTLAVGVTGGMTASAGGGTIIGTGGTAAVAVAPEVAIAIGVAQVVGSIRNGVAILGALTQIYNASNDESSKDSRGGRGRFQSGEDNLDQLDGVTKAQEVKGRDAIQSKRKSEQRVDNTNDRIQNYKDSLEEYDYDEP